jgi:hypothetical protein
MRVELHGWDWCPYKKDSQSVLSFSCHHMKTQQENYNLEEAFTQPDHVSTLNLHVGSPELCELNFSGL